MKATGGHTSAWVFQVWASFVVSSIATCVGILYLPGDPWMRAFLGMSVLFCVASAFSLSKTVRDTHEIDRANARQRGDGMGPPGGGAYRSASPPA